MNRTGPNAPGPDDPRGVGALLAHAAEHWPDHLALRSIEEGVREAKYAELHQRAAGVAEHLRQLGIRPGDRVALVAANGLDVVVAWFGAAYAGATVVPILLLSSPAEVTFRLEHSGCRILIHDGERAPLASAAPPRCQAITLEQLCEASSAPAGPPPRIAPESGAMILYTSGTTGKPKGAVISHRTLLAHSAGIGDEALRLDSEDRVLGVLPLAHSYGLRMVLLATFRAGCRAVLAPRFDAARTLQLMADEEITWLPAVPTMFSSWSALPDGPPLPSLRWCLSAGSPLAEEILHRAERRLGAEIRQGYGMTEATFSTINAPPDARTINSVGRPARGVELRITDERGRDVAPGNTGEVRVRGPNLMSAYLDDEAATREALEDGWMHTGDIGRIDEAGRLYVVDRLKDMILRGGFNVYPSELEAVLTEHPDVQDAAVVGRPDPHYGEEIVALVVPRPGANLTLSALEQWTGERVARNKRPREWALLDDLPLGPSRKVLKRELRDRVASGAIPVTRPGPI